jgi:uncharacterized GH25 family protein
MMASLKTARGVAAFVSVLAIAAYAHGHETWMLPTPFSARIGETVRFEMSSGMEFPRLENAIRPERVASASFRLGGELVELKGLKTSTTSLVVRHAFRKNGVATVAVDLKPKDIQLTDDQVAEYLDEIGATESLRSTWAGRKGSVPWTESYTKHAKTFVAVGVTKDDRSWAEGLGSAFEFVPATSPFAVETGHEFTVQLQANGHPVPALPVGLLMEGAETRAFRTTDAEGRATFPITSTGRAMLFAVDLRLAKNGTSWQSDFCTMTFAVGTPPER